MTRPPRKFKAHRIHRQASSTGEHRRILRGIFYRRISRCASSRAASSLEGASTKFTGEKEIYNIGAVNAIGLADARKLAAKNHVRSGART